MQPWCQAKRPAVSTGRTQIILNMWKPYHNSLWTSRGQYIKKIRWGPWSIYCTASEAIRTLADRNFVTLSFSTTRSGQRNLQKTWWMLEQQTLHALTFTAVQGWGTCYILSQLLSQLPCPHGDVIINIILRICQHNHLLKSGQTRKMM